MNDGGTLVWLPVQAYCSASFFCCDELFITIIYLFSFDLSKSFVSNWLKYLRKVLKATYSRGARD